MTARNTFAKLAAPSFFATTWLLFAAGPAPAAQVGHNVPQIIQQASDQGPANSDREIDITVHLKMRDRAAFDAAVQQLYNPASPTYHRWMTDADLQNYAPSAAQIATVQNELQKHGLSVISTDPLGFSMRVHGTVADVESAFQTSIHQFTMKNRSFRANIQDAKLTGNASNLIESVSGLTSAQVRPMIRRAANPLTGVTPPPIPLGQVNATGGLSSVLTDVCFTNPQAFVYTGAGNSLPIGVYFGNVYDNTTKVCGFTSAQLQAHYGLTAAYQAGLDGTGQTIALVEAYGYPTMLDDANAFSQLNGLPLLNSSNFQVVYPEGPPRSPNAAALTGWDVEIALDIQWAHSMAPGANIVVVAAAGQDNEDFQDALNYVRANHLANSVSNSWGVDLDLLAGPLELASYDLVLEMAAAEGISVQFSSGDDGDNGVGSPVGAPSVPADSPYVTAIGGTSILNLPNGTGQMELGWGNGLTQLASKGTLDPPLQLGFFGGSGGGESIWYSKPWWQGALPGTGRQVPDISALADPYTGVEVVVTQNGRQVLILGIGGTSLSSPVFSAIWAIASQNAGSPLGQAAPLIAGLSSNEVIDILPVGSLTNVAGTIYDSKGAHFYSPTDLLSQTLAGSTSPFFSAIRPVGSQTGYDVSFGTDTSLTVTPGWDNVTGFGVPNGLAFINAVSSQP